MRLRHLSMALLLPALALSAGTPRARKHASGPVKSAKEAKAIAEQETGGQATGARRIPLNGASGGWEVDVRMPHGEKGWRCVIDADTHQVHTKTRVDTPGEGPLRTVKGSR